MASRLKLSQAKLGGIKKLGLLLIQPLLTFVDLVEVRLLRWVQDRLQARRGRQGTPRGTGPKRLLLVGGGRTGVMLVRELESRRDLKIIGFVDDDRLKQKHVMHGIPVLGTCADLARILADHRIDEVVLALSKVSQAKIRRIASICEAVSVRTSSVPSMRDIILGKLAIDNLMPIGMEELLGRENVEFGFDEAVRGCFRGRRILVTGAGGSIGSELCRQLALLEPEGLILLDRDENALYEIGLEMREDFPGPLTQVVADVRDYEHMDRLFDRFRPQVVFHAAAYKHVPMMERDPREAVLNNVVGTRNVVSLSSRNRVESFVLISTDKAVNPTSVMGASKRVAEMIVQERAHRERHGSFCCVRFGNVLGSRASVVPIFQKRIAQGRALHVTHPEIRRFFMTIAEAVRLVIQAGSMGREGEIFLLDMGDPVKITTLARELIELSGLVPGKDIRIEFTGLRPGEKLFEELLVNTENGDRSTRYPKIFVATATQLPPSHLEGTVRGLEQAARSDDVDTILGLFDSLDIGFAAGAQPDSQGRGKAKPLLESAR